MFLDIDEDLGTAVQLSLALKERGVLIGPMGGQRMRAATHLDIPSDSIPTVLSAMKDCVASGFADQEMLGSGPYSR